MSFHTGNTTNAQTQITIFVSRKISCYELLESYLLLVMEEVIWLVFFSSHLKLLKVKMWCDDGCWFVLCTPSAVRLISNVRYSFENTVIWFDSLFIPRILNEMECGYKLWPRISFFGIAMVDANNNAPELCTCT